MFCRLGFIAANGTVGIAKKWIDALKADVFHSDTFEYFLEAFRTILTMHPSGESLRSLALFVTYATHVSKRRDTSPLRSARSSNQQGFTTPRRQTLSMAFPSSVNESSSLSSELGRTQLAVKILRMYTAILCDDRDTTNIKKFARTVTNRVSVSSARRYIQG